MRRRKVALVQQGVWDTPLESMPLAMGYLKAVALSDDRIRSELGLEIFNFTGGATLSHMAQRIFSETVPDVLACSVFGWNYGQFGALAETFRQLNPDGLVIWGGTHVAHQAERTFRVFPDVNVLVNGEGEFVFTELLRSYLGDACALDQIEGISFRDGDGGVTTTPDRGRIMDLDSVPSPFITGAIDLADRDGRFRYDVALMETNRGCPYRCAFCYWGGATGQKVRTFSRERLREELEIFAHHKVETVVLCDANFGMLPADREFLEDLIRTRERYGFPRTLETSWAKNKSRVFYSIVERMKEAGLRSSFTLALQTLSDSALGQMRRRNMRVNDWEVFVRWLTDLGLDCYAELIWGAPGETAESFLEGYDRLARHVPRVATYPLLLLPNTEYSASREQFGFVTIRGRSDDFEYVLAHNDMTMEENRTMHGFLLWARTVAENLYLRAVWTPLREFAGMTQSQALLSMRDWFEEAPYRATEGLKASRIQLGDPGAVLRTLRYLYSTPQVPALLKMWFEECVSPHVSPEKADVLREILRYDLLTRPIYDDPEGLPVPLPTRTRDGAVFYCGAPERFEFDVAEIVACMRRGHPYDLAPHPVVVTVEYKAGFHQQLANHEMSAHYVGQAHVEPITGSGSASSERSVRTQVDVDVPSPNEVIDSETPRRRAGAAAQG